MIHANSETFGLVLWKHGRETGKIGRVEALGLWLDWDKKS